MNDDSNNQMNGCEGQEGLLTVDEVARFMKLTKGTVYRWAKRGGIPCIKVGDTVRFSPASLRLWLASGMNHVGGRDGQ